MAGLTAHSVSGFVHITNTRSHIKLAMLEKTLQLKSGFRFLSSSQVLHENTSQTGVYQFTGA